MTLTFITRFNDAEHFVGWQTAKGQAHVDSIKTYLFIYRIINNVIHGNNLIFALEKYVTLFSLSSGL